jgi:deoxyadenosine/deoxycytidine kinase
MAPMSTSIPSSNHKPAWTDRFRSIVIEGPIGVGKSSLAMKFANRFGYAPLLEAPEENPFLSKFYRDSARYALPTQLFFLFQRIDQLREITQRDLFSELIVSDFMIEKDPLFASLTLSDEELSLYRKIYEVQRPQAPAADLVVVLQASADSLIERIRQRGVPMEQSMSEDYLRSLSEAYTNYFHHYDQSPLLIVNTDQLNPIDREKDFDALIQQIANYRGRRSFFNALHD